MGLECYDMSKKNESKEEQFQLDCEIGKAITLRINLFKKFSKSKTTVAREIFKFLNENYKANENLGKPQALWTGF